MDTVYTEQETGVVAGVLIQGLVPTETHATVVGLSGDLGAGKTTLVQSVATVLGVQERVVSPTFVIAKFYETTHSQWKKLIHIDAYRIEDTKELEILGWDTIVQEPQTLVVIEWPEIVSAILPQTTIRYTIEHNGHSRHITRT